MEDLFQTTKELCRLYNIKPVRSKGQNFLIEEKIYDEIAAAAELKPDDTVLEVGPGLGFLTARLAARVKKVIAVELDDKLAEVLKFGLEAKGVKNVQVVNDDILELRAASYELRDYKIVANLPYNITSIFLRKILEAENKPNLMVLMLQKEVVERICAKAGEMSMLAVSVQFYAEPELIEIVPKNYFWPEPEVLSAIIKLKIKSRVPDIDEKNFFRLVKFGFSAKRKMLKNNLAAGWRLDQAEVEKIIIQAGFNPKIRAQELSLDDWLKLFSEFERHML
ncbi:MAG: 16S rRNA (adenine(1518)-N(6)/adenine(1519)-N(6))-dimethyltransferase RsmA [bacterium]|nr:16S rRNA (adenine(1518)-N(6)/adenine(1519)-N(6))-dimethyltransferase RsmA [bacterium]